MAEILTPERFEMHRRWVGTIGHTGARVALTEMIATIDALVAALRAAQKTWRKDEDYDAICRVAAWLEEA